MRKFTNVLATLMLALAMLAVVGCTPDENKLGVICGTVSDYSSGEPIGNANVRLNPRGETTLTGSDGSFQFNDLEAGSYSLSLSKNGYVDLDDDYVMEIKNGNTVRRDVQMQKQSASLQIVDNNGNAIAMLDFGTDEGVTQKTFNIFNNGNISLDFTITKSAAWIEDVVPSQGTVAIGDTKPITVIINRASLGSGENKSTLLVTTPSAGGVEVLVKATVPFTATVVTGEVTEVTNNSAKCSGEVTDNGGVTVIEKGICFALTENPTIDDQRVSAGPGIGEFTCILTGLTQNKTYYVRAYAINSVGTSYGLQRSFTTKSAPTVATLNVTNVTENSATCSGNVSSEGGSSVTERGVCYSLAPNPTINNTTVTSGSGTGSFTCELTNLTKNTKYYVKAYAKNSYGVAYGDEKSFTTDAFPTFQYGGHTYYVAPDPGNYMEWSAANSYCNNLSLEGMTGWKMPTRDELVQMYADRNSIGGFYITTSTIYTYVSYYWSSTIDNGTGNYFHVGFSNGNVSSATNETSTCRVRPIKRKN
ncbi:MAG: DUF1566 domain-containing protein [Bacteroidales bacterium]|nr:DUF1566 domain-containing protein [Bacteroidales bacterium]